MSDLTRSGANDTTGVLRVTNRSVVSDVGGDGTLPILRLESSVRGYAWFLVVFFGLCAALVWVFHWLNEVANDRVAWLPRRVVDPVATPVGAFIQAHPALSFAGFFGALAVVMAFLRPLMGLNWAPVSTLEAWPDRLVVRSHRATQVCGWSELVGYSDHSNRTVLIATASRWRQWRGFRIEPRTPEQRTALLRILDERGVARLA